MIKVTVKLTLGNELGFTCASCLVFMSSKAEHTVVTEGSGRSKCWQSEEFEHHGKEHRRPLEPQQPDNDSLESPCSPNDTLILAQRNSFSISNLHTFKIINLCYFSHKLCILLHQQPKSTQPWYSGRNGAAGKQALPSFDTARITQDVPGQGIH